MKLNFFEALPEAFDRQTFMKVAEELGIKEKNAERYISMFKSKLLRREGHEYFKNTNRMNLDELGYSDLKI
jgi:hypothetical protein